MIKPIYKRENETLKQQFIKSNEEIPTGWTDNLSSLDIEKQPSEVENLQNEVKQLQQELANTQAALSDVQTQLDNKEV